MVEITDRVSKIEDILYPNELTGENGLLGEHNEMKKDMLFFKRFLKWFSGIFGFISLCVLALLGIGVKYNIDLIEKVAALAAQLAQYMAGK